MLQVFQVVLGGDGDSFSDGVSVGEAFGEEDFPGAGISFDDAKI